MFFDWRRVVVYTHRWVGVAGCALFLAWFVSGIVLMYAGMPELPAADRRALLPALDLSSARASPADAARAADVTPQRVRVGMFGQRPVYRLFDRGRWTTVFADTAQPLEPLSQDDALDEMRRLLPAHASTLRYDARLNDADQWTFDSRALMPLHRIAIGDAAGTVFYLSDQTGEPVMRTSRRERRWAYAGAILHWMYFTPFRRHSDVWAQSIIWASIGGIVLCLSGLVWGLWRFSPVERYRLKRVPSRTPYAGWMRWHHYAGLLFGLTTFTWMFSGLLSMDPWDWHPSTSPTLEQRERLSGGPLRWDVLSLDGLRGSLAALAAASSAATAPSPVGAASPPRELEVVQFQGEPFYLADHRLVPARTPARGPIAAFDRDAVSAIARSALPGVAVNDAVWLERYDAYYYDRRGALALPVLRVRYLDGPRTWLYVDPGRGAIVRKEERLTRVNRWLYHGFHSLDFPFLYYRRPLWDMVVIVLSLGGIASTLTIVQPALRRIRRWRRRHLE